MANNQDYKIRIEADNSGAIQAFDQLGNKIKATGDDVATSSQKMSSGFDSAIAGLTGMVAGFVSVQTVIRSLEFNAVFEGVKTGFETLQGGAQNAEASLQELRGATVGLVSDFDLMKQANQAISLGIPVEQFDDLAAAAVKLGQKVGQDATGSIESLIAAVGRASPLMLDNLGIKLKMAEAEEIYADRLNKSVKALTEEEKANAFKEAAMEKIIEAAKVLNINTESSAVLYQQLTVEVENAGAAFAVFIANLPQLNSLLKDGVGYLRDFTTGLRALQDGTRENLTLGLTQMQTELQGLEATIASFDNRLVKGKVGSALVDSLFGTKEEYENKAAGLRNAINVLQADLAESLKRSAKAADDTAASVGKIGTGGNLPKVTSDANNLEKALREQQKAIDDLRRAEEARAKTALQVVERSKSYQAILDKLKKGEIDNAKAAEQMNVVLRDKIELLRTIETLTGEVQRALQGMAAGAEVDLSKLTEAMGQLNDAQGQLNADFDLPTPEASDTAAFDGYLGQLNDGINLVKQTEQALTELSDLGKAGFVIGAALGAYFGGTAGAAAGGAIGATLGDMLDGWSLFSGNNVGAKARDRVDAYFEDLLDAHRLKLIIDGQLTEIDQIVEEHFADGSTAYNNTFSGLSSSAQSTFANIGDLFTDMFDGLDDIAGQWGNVLANNLGGSLNNLQIMLGALEISQEQLMEQLETMWLDGNISAQGYLTTAAQIQDVYTQGIPGAMGATDQAFQNLIDSGGAGRQVLDALGDAAAEAAEKGISTLQGLKEDLIASGADAEKIEQLFNALAAAGVTSLQQLQDVGTSTAVAVAAELEKTGNFFSDINEELDSMEERYKALKDKEVNLTFNVKTNVDANTEKMAGTLSEAGYNYNFGATQ